jgi:hypothetical protein
MPAPIVIDVGVADPPRELASALVDACTQAATSAGIDCRLVRDAPNGPYTAIAIVTWEEGERARVEVGLRREATSEWRTRELTFQAADADVERYRSVGFVIGSLATAARDEAVPKTAPKPEPKPEATPEPKPETKPETKPEPPPPPVTAPKATPVVVGNEPVEPPSEPGPPSSPRRYGWIGVVGTAGGGLDRGGARWGGQLSLGVRVLPRLAALASGGASVRPRDAPGLMARWIEGGVGAAVLIGPKNGPHLDLRGQLLLEQFWADAESDAQSQHMTRVAFGGRVGADGVLAVGDIVDVVVGVEMTFMPPTSVNIGDQSAGASRIAELAASAGLRFEL